MNNLLKTFVTLSLVLIAATLLFVKNANNQLASQNNIMDLSGLFDTSDISGAFHGKEIFTYNPAAALPVQNVLGKASEEKRIEVDLTNQRLYAYEGDKKVYDFLVSTGKWGKTPTGEFNIWVKLRYTKMSGGSKALHTYYYLPNVPYTMFFSNDEVPSWRGFGIHGTYWHDNFGHPMSHGCINMKTEEVEQIYYWANPELGEKQSIHASANNPGTKIIIYGEAPNE